jgi:surfeit locus 1 family protein
LSRPGAARRLLVPGLSTVAMLVVLIGLGTWQVQRMHWKHALLAQIASAEQHPAIPLGPDPLPFQKVQVEGVLRGDLAALYGAEVRDLPHGQTVLGAHLIEPLERPGQIPVLVDRGWVQEKGAPMPPAPPGPVTVEGYVRPAEHAGMFSAADDTAARRFFTLDPGAIGPALGLARVAPFTLVALGPPGIPDPAHALPRPPDNHLQYALTWYGFAVTLLVIFLLYARKVLFP